jgi:hypothetical protein
MSFLMRSLFMFFLTALVMPNCFACCPTKKTTVTSAQDLEAIQGFEDELIHFKLYSMPKEQRQAQERKYWLAERDKKRAASTVLVKCKNTPS